jgi:hypothetical protein
VAVTVFGFTIEKFLRYQFRTALGLKFAFLSFTSMFVNYIVMMVVKKPKYDF